LDLVGWLLLDIEDFTATEEPVFDLVGFCF
jgi:hypothetical protein